MITFSLIGVIALVILLLVAALAFVSFFEQPMRMRMCFGISAVSIAYILYILVFQQHDPALKFDWYLAGIVGIYAAMELFGVGYRQSKKKTPNTMAYSDLSKESVLLSSDESVILDEEAKEDDKEEEHLASDDTAIVLAWFFGQLDKFSVEEQNAIKVCVGEFVNDGTIKAPSVKIVRNEDLNQEDIYMLCSCFLLIGKKRMDCVQFAKIVFASYFIDTVDSTIEKKIKGKNTMRELIGL